MNDGKSKIRCSCCAGSCSCAKGGKPVPVPASLPGRLAGVPPMVAADSPTVWRSAPVPRKRTPAQEAQRLAAMEQFYRSQPPSVRRRVGLPPHPEEPTPVLVSAAVPWRYTPSLVASGGERRPFYASQDAKDRAYRAFFDAARTIAHAESGNLPREKLTNAQMAVCCTYATLMVEGAVGKAVEAMGILRANAARVLRARSQAVLDGALERSQGRAAVWAARARRRSAAQMQAFEVRVYGPERARARRELRGLRTRVDRLRAAGGGSAA